MDVDLPEGYTPTEKESYMNDRQLEFFRRRLLDWKQELLKESEQTVKRMREGTLLEADPLDQGTSETEWAFELRTRDRYRKLIKKIDQALERIEDGSYGFCEETGEEIGIKRLMARPVATLSISAQERHEREERLQKGR
ncbi:MAG: RNA polymerase-binding protein DksA [Thermodesulfobacteriota bacterium]